MPLHGPHVAERDGRTFTMKREPGGRYETPTMWLTVKVDEGIKFTYLEYGGYASKWKERLAVKLWAGFPTFPMVFLDGSLVGGFSELEKLKAEGKLKR